MRSLISFAQAARSLEITLRELDLPTNPRPQEAGKIAKLGRDVNHAVIYSGT